MGFYDLTLDWAGDLGVTAQGDLALLTGLDLLKQRIIRRILTNKKELIFEPKFGAGLPMYVWEGVSPSIFAEIKQRIIQEVYKEEVVVRDPEPEISFTTSTNSVEIFIRVWTIDSKSVALNIEVSRSG